MDKITKKGLKSYKIDVDFLSSDIIKFVTVERGGGGVCVVLKLLSNIFKQGYYISWGKDDPALLAWELRGIATKDDIDNVVRICLDRGYFNKKVFEVKGILTSADIQEMYVQATRCRKKIEIESGSWLLSDMPANAEIVNECSDYKKDADDKKNERADRKTRKASAITIPSLDDVVSYFKDKGYKEDAAKKAWAYYDAAGWRDSRGKPVKSWKQKMIAVWMQPENIDNSVIKKQENEGCINF